MYLAANDKIQKLPRYLKLLPTWQEQGGGRKGFGHQKAREVIGRRRRSIPRSVLAVGVAELANVDRCERVATPAKGARSSVMRANRSVNDA